MFQKIYVSIENSFKTARTITVRGWFKSSAPALKDPAMKRAMWAEIFELQKLTRAELTNEKL